MDQEDIVRRGLEVFNGEGTEAFLDFLAANDLMHPEFTFHIQEDLPNGGAYEGPDGFRSMAAQWLEAWREFDVVMREIVRGGDERLLVPVEQRAVASGSGVEVSGEFLYVFVFEAGRVREIHLLADRDLANRTAGIGD